MQMEINLGAELNEIKTEYLQSTPYSSLQIPKLRRNPATAFHSTPLHAPPPRSPSLSSLAAAALRSRAGLRCHCLSALFMPELDADALSTAFCVERWLSLFHCPRLPRVSKRGRLSLSAADGCRDSHKSGHIVWAALSPYFTSDVS